MTKFNQLKEAITVIKEGLASYNYNYDDKIFDNLPLDKIESVSRLQTQINLSDIVKTVVLYSLLFLIMISIIRMIELFALNKASKKCFISSNIVVAVIVIILVEIALYFAVNVYMGFSKEDALMDVRMYMDYAKAVRAK